MGVLVVVDRAEDCLAGLGHQRAQLDCRGLPGGGPAAWSELESAHGPTGHVGEAVEGGHVGGGHTLVGHVAVDQGVTEVVGQRVAQQRGQALVGRLWEVGE